MLRSSYRWSGVSIFFMGFPAFLLGSVKKGEWCPTLSLQTLSQLRDALGLTVASGLQPLRLKCASGEQRLPTGVAQLGAVGELLGAASGWRMFEGFEQVSKGNFEALAFQKDGKTTEWVSCRCFSSPSDWFCWEC